MVPPQYTALLLLGEQISGVSQDKPQRQKHKPNHVWNQKIRSLYDLANEKYSGFLFHEAVEFYSLPMVLVAS